MSGLLRACAGLIVWAVVFGALYAIEGIGCAGGWNPVTLRTLLIAVWLVGLGGLAWLSWRWWPRSGDALIDWIAGVVAIVGLVSTLWTGIPVATLSVCL